MNSHLPNLPGFWRTVLVILRAARKRAAGRRRRQQELLHQRSGGKGVNWGGFGFFMAILFMMVLNVLAAFTLRTAVSFGQRAEAERHGKIVVSRWFLEQVDPQKAGNVPDLNRWGYRNTYSDIYATEAKNITRQYGGKEEEVAQKLRDMVREGRVQDLVSADEAAPGIIGLPGAGTFPAMMGSFVLIWWGAMLVFQGEGLELDLQRRSHPMWEWLFSHPVKPGAVFFAEMLTPIAANPIFWGAPLFAGFVYGFVYDFQLAVLAMFLIGIPLTLAAACLGKAVEIAVLLRFSPRTRGAVVGLIGWMGYASMMMLFIGFAMLPKILAVLAKPLGYLLVLPWPWLKLFLGGTGDGSFSFLAGLLACWSAAVLAIALAVSFSVWGAKQGLSGNFARAESRPSVARKTQSRFGRDPLYRKEFLWFIRDRSAIVQVILIPLTVAGFQLFNLRDLISAAQGAWNYLCGSAILFGTYFLWILGPRSLSSEGPALWIALTWPRGLESLLKAKAWLWSMIASAMVALVLGYAVYLFPRNAWQILLVGIGWFLFARSMAEKSVTLVSVMSSSGEAQKVTWGQRWAAQLGMMTFSIGILTQQWPTAVVGIVYSYITAAAMWQNFRARLPYLYDPWSEKLPPPPTLMHAMIAISILVEGGAVVTGIFSIFTGREYIALAQAMSYGVCAIFVSIGMSSFLRGRNLSSEDVWGWLPAIGSSVKSFWRSNEEQDQSQSQGQWRRLVFPMLLGVGGGLLLGLFAHGYLALLHHIPAIAETLRKSEELLKDVRGLRISYAVMAVAFAPFAEEYLFRGLLYRALDREWGGWRAVAGSAAFFAIYHPLFSWLPVALLGACAALLFKKTGRLESAVLLHLVYNAVVVSW